MVVAVYVVDGEYAVFTLRKVADGELTVLVGARNSLHGECGEGGIGQIGVYAHEHALGGFEIVGLKDHAGYSQGVDGVAG